MSSLKRYNEVAVSPQKIGNRKIAEGDIIRTVSITERDAEIMNDTEKSKGSDQLVRYEPEEKEGKKVSEKELRKELFAKAESFGLTVMKNIKTDDLKKMVEDKEKENEGK